MKRMLQQLSEDRVQPQRESKSSGDISEFDCENETYSPIKDGPVVPSLGSHHDGSFGVYMAHKVTKLRDMHRSDKVLSDIFKKCVIYVNGITNPPKEEIRRLVSLHGGECIAYKVTHITHMVCDYYTDAQLKAEYAKARINNSIKNKVLHNVTAQWIVDSVTQMKRLSEVKYCPEGFGATRYGGSISAMFGAAVSASSSASATKTHIGASSITSHSVSNTSNIASNSNSGIKQHTSNSNVSSSSGSSCGKRNIGANNSSSSGVSKPIFQSDNTDVDADDEFISFTQPRQQSSIASPEVVGLFGGVVDLLSSPEDMFAAASSSIDGKKPSNVPSKPSSSSIGTVAIANNTVGSKGLAVTSKSAHSAAVSSKAVTSSSSTTQNARTPENPTRLVPTIHYQLSPGQEAFIASSIPAELQSEVYQQLLAIKNQETERHALEQKAAVPQLRANEGHGAEQGVSETKFSVDNTIAPVNRNESSGGNSSCSGSSGSGSGGHIATGEVVNLTEETLEKQREEQERHRSLCSVIRFIHQDEKVPAVRGESISATCASIVIARRLCAYVTKIVTLCSSSSSSSSSSSGTNGESFGCVSSNDSSCVNGNTSGHLVPPTQAVKDLLMDYALHLAGSSVDDCELDLVKMLLSCLQRTCASLSCPVDTHSSSNSTSSGSSCSSVYCAECSAAKAVWSEHIVEDIRSAVDRRLAHIHGCRVELL